MDLARHGTLHHVELWVPNLDRALSSWGWLLAELGYEIFQEWPGGKSWRCGPTYIVIEQSPARTATRHDRCRPGLNHLAFHVESRAKTDELSVDAGQHGWRLMFADQYPYAGGTGHYAAYLENIDGFEAELVALSDPVQPGAAASGDAAAASPAAPASPGPPGSPGPLASPGSPAAPADNSKRRPAPGQAVPVGTGVPTGSDGPAGPGGTAPTGAAPPAGSA